MSGMISPRHLATFLFMLCVLMFAAQSSVAQEDEDNTDVAVEDAITNATDAAATAAATQAGQNAAAAIPGFFSFGNPAAPAPEEEEIKKKQVYYGETREDYQREAGVPPDLNRLMALPKDPDAREEDGEGLPFDIRRDALREAAISYGARGGLAWRTYKIRQELKTRERFLDKIYDFRQFLIPGPSGMMIEPPIITEAMNALLIESGGQSAAVSDRIYNIINNANIVSAPRNWRSYLEREWGTVEPPPDILRPETEEERLHWQNLVTQGWEEGVEQADEIFQDDLNVLTADFQGMIRYRSLLAQGMVSPPYALQVDRGVTGDGDEMRVGDRAVQITGKPRLITGTDQWQPASP
ncbi:MAG: type IV secretion system DotC family protein [Alphaproteobacteria bacterium]